MDKKRNHIVPLKFSAPLTHLKKTKTPIFQRDVSVGTLEFPAVEAWRAQEAVLDGVEACPPWHAADGGARRRRRGGRPTRAVLGGVHWGALWGGEGAASGGRVRGDLYEGDRFRWVVRERGGGGGGGRRRHRVEVMQPDG